MAQVEIFWCGGEERIKCTYDMKPGLYIIRVMDDRVPFRIVEGLRPEQIARGLSGSVNENGDSFVIAASDDVTTRLETDWSFPGEPLMTIKPLKHVPSGRHPSITDAKIVIEGQTPSRLRHRRKNLRSRERAPVRYPA